MPYSKLDIHDAESLVNYQAVHSRDATVRARAKITAALIKFLDSQKHEWRDDLAKTLSAKMAAGELTDFNPDAPFTLDFASIDELLARMVVGNVSGLTIKDEFANKPG